MQLTDGAHRRRIGRSIGNDANDIVYRARNHDYGGPVGDTMVPVGDTGRTWPLLRRLSGLSSSRQSALG